MAELKLITGNSNLPLAEKIAKYIGIELTSREVKRFSDGEVFIQINDNIRGADVFIMQSTNAPAENILELLILIEAARRASASRITAVIPYYGYARQDRKDKPRVAITAKLIANLITVAGADRIMTMDLHASQIQGFFDLPHDHLYSSRVFNDYLKNLQLNDAVVVAPDVGSIKMARAFAKTTGAGLAIIDKRRPYHNQSEVVNIIGEVAGRPIIIRDDMVDTAGTITRAAEALKEKGALDIYACCTHAVLSGNALERIEKSPIKQMIISDSLNVENKGLTEKFQVLSCANLLGEAIMRISGEKSVSSLFDDLPV
jgi:ribose-phosphate pyrophosphokinase